MSEASYDCIVVYEDRTLQKRIIALHAIHIQFELIEPSEYGVEKRIAMSLADDYLPSLPYGETVELWVFRRTSPDKLSDHLQGIDISAMEGSRNPPAILGDMVDSWHERWKREGINSHFGNKHGWWFKRDSSMVGITCMRTMDHPDITEPCDADCLQVS